MKPVIFVIVLKTEMYAVLFAAGNVSSKVVNSDKLKPAVNIPRTMFIKSITGKFQRTRKQNGFIASVAAAITNV